MTVDVATFYGFLAVLIGLGGLVLLGCLLITMRDLSRMLLVLVTGLSDHKPSIVSSEKRVYHGLPPNLDDDADDYETAVIQPPIHMPPSYKQPPAEEEEDLLAWMREHKDDPNVPHFGSM